MTSPAPAWPSTREAMCTAMPPTSSAGEVALARVHARAHVEPVVARRLGDRDRAAHRARGPVEGGQEAVAHRLDLAAAVARELRADDRLVLLQQLLPALRRPASAARRVESTMSVNRTVASTRSSEYERRVPVMNSSSASATALTSPASTQRVGAGELDQLRVGHVVDDVLARGGGRSSASSRRRITSVGTSIERQHLAHVVLAHLTERGGHGARARRRSARAARPGVELLVVGQARGEERRCRRRRPSAAGRWLIHSSRVLGSAPHSQSGRRAIRGIGVNSASAADQLGVAGREQRRPSPSPPSPPTPTPAPIRPRASRRARRRSASRAARARRGRTGRCRGGRTGSAARTTPSARPSGRSRGCSQSSSTCETHDGMKTRSGGPEPNTW